MQISRVAKVARTAAGKTVLEVAGRPAFDRPSVLSISNVRCSTSVPRPQRFSDMLRNYRRTPRTFGCGSRKVVLEQLWEWGRSSLYRMPSMNGAEEHEF